MDSQNTNIEVDNKKQIAIPVTHNFALFLIGVIVLGVVALGSYTFLKFTEYGLVSVSVNSANVVSEKNNLESVNNLKIQKNEQYPIPSDISVNPVFKNWLKYNKVPYGTVESSTFSTSNIKMMEIGKVFDCDTVGGLHLVVSPDGKRSTCFGSAGEPDSDLYLIDKTKKQSIRLEFCGTPCVYQDGFWLDENKFVFLWSMHDYEYENNNKQYHTLNVYLYNLSDKSLSKWVTKHLY